jgi:hypothetical protein
MSEEFDAYNFDYKSYMLETYGLTESPIMYRDYTIALDDWIANSGEAVKIEKDSNLIGHHKYGSFTFRIYQKIEEDNIFINLMEEHEPTIHLYHSYSEIKLDHFNGIVNHSIWNSRNFRGLARDWIFNNILKNYECVMSDGVHTPKGKWYWEKLFLEAFSKKFKCGIIDMKNNNQFTEIKSKEEVYQYYGDGKANIRLIIFRK